jgi:LuxR family quorum-sensing system transcriptional regulator CciR
MVLTALQSQLTVGAFDCIASMKAARDVRELSAAAGAIFTDMALPSFALARFFKRTGEPDVAILDGEFHKEWSQRYLANRYVDVSQIAREMTATAAPYSWGDVMDRPDISEAQKRVRNEAGSMGLEDGLFTPIAWPDGSYVAVAVAGRSRDLADPMVRTWTEILSSYYGCEARRFLARPAAAAGVRLSPRQRECLIWVRHGKSSGMISEILGLSVQTVDDHISEACRKFGVRTRTQAAVEATLAGMIE